MTRSKKCQKCGTMVFMVGAQRFCPWCGTELFKAGEEDKPTPIPATTNVPPGSEYVMPSGERHTIIPCDSCARANCDGCSIAKPKG
ncbi:MAG: hypothetical protein WC551_10160 [Patescibacteria group bacterium]